MELWGICVRNARVNKPVSLGLGYGNEFPFTVGPDFALEKLAGQSVV